MIIHDFLFVINKIRRETQEKIMRRFWVGPRQNFFVELGKLFYFQNFFELLMYTMNRQWCLRKRSLRKTPEGVYKNMRGLSKASFIWKDPSDPCNPPLEIFLGHHWRSIVYVFWLYKNLSLRSSSFSLLHHHTGARPYIWNYDLLDTL